MAKTAGAAAQEQSTGTPARTAGGTAEGTGTATKPFWDRNEVKVTGRITTPKTKETSSGPVTEFGVAMKQGEKTMFINFSAWKRQQQIAAKIPKGCSVTVEGRIKEDSWQDKETKKEMKAIKFEATAIYPDLLDLERKSAPASTPNDEDMPE